MRVTVRLSNDQAQYIKMLQREFGVAYAEYIRLLIDDDQRAMTSIAQEKGSRMAANAMLAQAIKAMKRNEQ